MSRTVNSFAPWLASATRRTANPTSEASSSQEPNTTPQACTSHIPKRGPKAQLGVLQSLFGPYLEVPSKLGSYRNELETRTVMGSGALQTFTFLNRPCTKGSTRTGPGCMLGAQTFSISRDGTSGLEGLYSRRGFLHVLTRILFEDLSSTDKLLLWDFCGLMAPGLLQGTCCLNRGFLGE